jgi:hypothetical protein
MTLTIETTSTPTAPEPDNAEVWRDLRDALSSVVHINTDALTDAIEILNAANYFLANLNLDQSDVADLIMDLSDAVELASRVEGEVSDLLTRDYEDWPEAGSGPLPSDNLVESFIARVGADRVLGALDRLTSPTA